MNSAAELDAAAESMMLDPTRSNIVVFCGMKGRGKSIAARQLFDAWPADRVVVDPTGDARPDDPDTIGTAAPFPSQLPAPKHDQRRVTIWARVDPKSPTYTADEAAATMMALHPRSRTKMIWRDEFGQGTSPHTITPADRTLLSSSRHYHASALLLTQRPLNIPKLTLQQADLVGVWTIRDPDDRQYIAKNCGIDVPMFERQYHDNQRRGKHAFLLIDLHRDRLLNLPALPNIEARGPKS